MKTFFKVSVLAIIMLVVLVVAVSTLFGRGNNPPAVGNLDVSKVNANIQVDANGLTVEQGNILHRYKVDNTPGAIKHLYVISPYSGQVLIYSTVKGKVTSSGKRLNPSSVVYEYQSGIANGFSVDVRGTNCITTEVIHDDGTYSGSGGSTEYIYWWDSRDIYHQQFLTGGEIIHISDQPLAVKNVILNMELVN